MQDDLQECMTENRKKSEVPILAVQTLGDKNLKWYNNTE
jgi:hypothetical protein